MWWHTTGFCALQIVLEKELPLIKHEYEGQVQLERSDEHNAPIGQIYLVHIAVRNPLVGQFYTKYMKAFVSK